MSEVPLSPGSRATEVLKEDQEANPGTAVKPLESARPLSGAWKDLPCSTLGIRLTSTARLGPGTRILEPFLCLGDGESQEGCLHGGLP